MGGTLSCARTSSEHTQSLSLFGAGVSCCVGCCVVLVLAGRGVKLVNVRGLLEGGSLSGGADISLFCFQIQLSLFHICEGERFSQLQLRQFHLYVISYI